MAFKTGNRSWMGQPTANYSGYRCVYCKRYFGAFSELTHHEPVCDARYIVKRQWAMEIEKARRREAKRLKEEGEWRGKEEGSIAQEGGGNHQVHQGDERGEGINPRTQGAPAPGHQVRGRASGARTGTGGSDASDPGRHGPSDRA